MAIAGRVRASELPLDQLVVIGSGLLDQLGLRQSNDVDLAVDPVLFERLKQTGEYVIGVKHGDEYLEKGDYEIWKDWGEALPYEKLRAESHVIDGIAFVSAVTLIAWKRERGLEKDLRDIAMLEAYYHSQTEGESV